MILREIEMEISLYIHVPFCRHKCDYCDFYSLAGIEDRLQIYTEAVCRELRFRSVQYHHPRVRTVFFGGGTPTLLSGQMAEKIMSEIRSGYTLCDECEMTMEGNPGTLTAENLDAYRKAGINRLSLGVQSFSDTMLSAIGRIHTSTEAEEAVHMARRAGFCNINLDLMYGLPGQDTGMLRETIRAALSLKPEHLSCYSLIVEEGTLLSERLNAGGGAALPDEDTVCEMEDVIHRCLKEDGYERYEVSNYAKTGFRCAHNIVYWECLPYLGIGPGAHSDCGGTRFSHPADLSSWTDHVMQGRMDALDEQEGTGSLQERRYERMMMGLRMTRGVDLRRFRQDFGLMPEKVWPRTIREMEEQNMIFTESGRLALTERGMDVMNYWLVRMIEEEEQAK